MVFSMVAELNGSFGQFAARNVPKLESRVSRETFHRETIIYRIILVGNTCLPFSKAQAFVDLSQFPPTTSATFCPSHTPPRPAAPVTDPPSTWTPPSSKPTVWPRKARGGARHHSYTGQRGYQPLLVIAAGTGATR